MCDGGALLDPPPMFRQERNLLSVAYKNVVGARRASLRIVGSIQNKEEGKGDSGKVAMIASYKAKVEEELNTICMDILSLLDVSLIKESLAPEPKVFYQKVRRPPHIASAASVHGLHLPHPLPISPARASTPPAPPAPRLLFPRGQSPVMPHRASLPIPTSSHPHHTLPAPAQMKADYFRYLAEFSDGATKIEHAEAAEKAYTAATEAASSLAPTHPIRLGLALNYSVFMYEVQGKQPDACALAKQARMTPLPPPPRSSLLAPPAPRAPP